MSVVEVELLGSPVFLLDKKEVFFTRKKAVALVVYLICTNRRVVREEIAQMFWPKCSQSKAMGSLRTVISEIKSIFPKEFIHIEGNSLYFDQTSIKCDLLEFREKFKSYDSLNDLKKAADLWKGGFIKGFHINTASSFNDWQLQEEQNIFINYKQLLKIIYEKEISNNNLISALNYAKTCLSLDNFDEESHRAVIYIHALNGERKLALKQYELCCKIIKEEFKSFPEIETETLINRIKNGEIKKASIINWLNNGEPRLAILPFRAIKYYSKEQLFFLDMVIEGLEDFFVSISGIKTISRTSTLAYANLNKTVSQIATELQVNYIIEGFLREEGESLLLEGRLIETKTDSVIKLNSLNIFSIEKQNPVDVAKNFGKLFLSSIKKNSQISSKNTIYDNGSLFIDASNSIKSKLKLQAKHLLRISNQSDCLKAVELYRKVIKIDPNDAQAWAGIGASFFAYCDKEICCPTSNNLLIDAQNAAKMALKIDENEPTALNILANIAVQKEWDFIKAENLYKKSLKIFSNNPRAMRDYAELCILSGRYFDAMNLSNMSNELDPVNHQNFKIRFWLYLVNKEYEKAYQVVKQQFLLYPAPDLECIMLSYIELIQGEADKAIDLLSSVKGPLLKSWENALLGAKGYAFAKKGEKDKTYDAIELLKKNLPNSVLPHLPIALSYTGLKEYNKAIDWIELAVNLHDPALFFLSVNPLFADLTYQNRFLDVLKSTHIISIKK